MTNRIIKTPAEIFPIWFNFSYDLAAGIFIQNYELTCVDKADGVDSKPTIILSDVLSSPEVMVVVRAGSEGEVHQITCRGLTGGGSFYDRELLLEIKTVVTDDFTKQPNDAFLFEVEFDRRLIPGDSLASAEATGIDEATGLSVAGINVFEPTVSGSNVGVPVLGGANMRSYLIGVLGTTAAGYVYEKVIRMSVREL